MTNQSNILLGTSGKELSAAEQSRMGFMTTIPDENGANIYAEADSHLLAIGDTGSSKTRSMVIPILLSSPNSTVVFDTTGEIYAVTNRYRRQKGITLSDSAWTTLNLIRSTHWIYSSFLMHDWMMTH